MLLNFESVEELRLIENALYFYCYNLTSDGDKFKYIKLLEKLSEEIEYYDTSEQKD